METGVAGKTHANFSLLGSERSVQPVKDEGEPVICSASLRQTVCFLTSGLTEDDVLSCQTAQKDGILSHQTLVSTQDEAINLSRQALGPTQQGDVLSP